MKKVKLTLFAFTEGKIICRKNPKKFTKKALDAVIEFSKFSAET